ncbi:alpha/beta hydrolase fold domain-containing protein, partial [Ferroplasma sp. Type II]
RDSGGPEILFQALITPMLDDRNNTPSSHMCSGLWPSWPREMNVLGWRALLGDRVGMDNVSPYAAPARAENLCNLPSAYIEVGGMEVFRDEDISYARRLMENNVPVELHVYPGTFHTWYAQVPEATVSKRALRNRMEWIQNQLKKK